MGSLGYYKIKQCILQQILSKYYRLEKADILCKEFNRFINRLQNQRKQEESKENYPWLDPSRKIYRFRKIMLNRKRKEGSNGHAV